MNKILALILIYTGFLFLGVSCRFQAKKVLPILESAEDLLETHPDSTLLILDEISDPQSLNKSLYYKYLLLQLQANYKGYKDITGDTLIFTIRDYYNDKRDIENATLASFYCGRVFEEQKNYQNAMQQFLETEKNLDKTNNLNLKGLCHEAIGKIYFKQYLIDNAIGHYMVSAEYYKQAGNYKNQIIANKFIANCLLLGEKKDSAIYYYDKALKMADKHRIAQQQSEIRQGLGIVYRELEEWGKSISYFNEAFKYASDSLNKAKLAANFARVYQLKGDSKSAISQLQLALNLIPGKNNNSLKANIYKTWSTIEENNNDYKNALYKYQLYNKFLAQVITDNKNGAILEIEAKYDSQLIENQNKKLKLQQQGIVIFFLGVILSLAILVLIAMIKVSKRERKLKEAEQKIFKMQEMSISYNEMENSFRNVLIRHFDILKKTALLEKYLNEDEKRKGQRLLKKFNEVVYEEQKVDWDILFNTLNIASNGCIKKLRDKLSHLDDSEFRVCCLIYSDFNNTEIALILNYRINTVEVKKSTIRKKLGIENRGNIKDFLNKCV